ncbi:putative membrane protein YpjA [Halarchaeum rubridurum]|uniref:Putative membrane protein YpjA n=1 Tax=Halarchaeum rubridurum TaxID=489911 RepID=A0A830G4A0_9EURY|nr:hypothetical protein [Halarchaeum rubridurum]MBP1955877.1 putative membrane protein YpjA [Halarchaeum rubridurum]GGM75024.1 hypothetical protein GCM10009017_26220 [Halarchaeum rubridurum]
MHPDLAPTTTAATPVLDGLLIGSLGLATLLFVLSLAAYTRRRTRSVLLLVASFGALFGYSLIAVLQVLGMVTEQTHHLVEHALVLVQSALVLAAVYYARTIERAAGDDETTLVSESRREE